VEKYIENGGNATQAVIDAKYKVKNKNVAKSIGSENLTKPDIVHAVKSIADSIICSNSGKNTPPKRLPS
jgi:phage terminase small subunit